MRAFSARSTGKREPKISGNACCTGVFGDKKVSAISSSRESASASCGFGPAAHNQANLSCGNAASFDKPPSANTSAASVSQHRVHAPRIGPQREAREHLVRDDRQAELDQAAASSSRLRKEPVGLLGFTTTIARVRALRARASESKSMCHAPS